MKNIINKSKVESNIERLKIYDNEGYIVFDKILKKLQQVNGYYSTNNSSNLNFFEHLMHKKFNVVKKNYKCNELVLTKTLNKYILVAQKNTKLFKNINQK